LKINFGKNSKPTNFCEIWTMENKIEYLIQFKGEFSTKKEDSFLGQKYTNIELNYGSIKFKGTPDEFDLFLSDLIKNEPDLKVIGIHDISETLIEIRPIIKQINKNEFYLVFEIYDSKQKFNVKFEDIIKILSEKNRERFQRSDEPIRAFVKKNDFKNLSKTPTK